MKKWLIGLACVGMWATAAMGQEPAVWFNEINYDPVGSDVAGSEWLEVAGPAGTDLSSYVVVRYNGANGASYGTTALSGTIDDEGCGYGAVELVYGTADSLQNGAPDGIALANVSGGVTTLVQFICYEGSFMATNGPAAGQTGANIGTQNGSVSSTLQLSGTATNYGGFTWVTNTATMGSLNLGQSITGCTPPPVTNVSFTASAVSVDENVGTYQVTVIKSLAEGDISGQIALSGTATYGAGADYTVDTTNFTLNGTTTSAVVTVTINDDSEQEAAETVILTLAGVAGGTVIAPSTFTLTINPNDIPSHAIAIVTNAPANGTVTTTPAGSAQEGATVTVSAIPVSGYAVQSILANGVAVIGNTFIMPTSDVTVTVTFVEAAASGALIISQYYEGTSNNKWIEIYNPGSMAIDLQAAGYRLGSWNNTNREGWKIATSADLTVVLSNSISAGGTYLVRHGSATNPAYATANQIATWAFNGDDSVVLYTGSTYAVASIADVFGMTATNAQDRSFVRKDTIATGVNTDFNAADWDEFTLAAVDAAGPGVNERLGYHSTGAAVFGVSFNRTNGFTVEQGASGSITATAVNGTAPYDYSWTSTLGEGYRTATSNVFTILATAPPGDYSATVVATDNAAQAVTNTVSFSVVVPPPKYAIAIVTNAPENGTVTTTPATEAAEGATVTVNATPVGGYAVDSIVVNGGAVTVNGASFTMPSTAVTVAVTFAVSVDPDALVDFETYTGTYAMTNYAAGGVTWTMTNAYAGNTIDDRKNGTKAARLENNRGGVGNPARMTSTAFGQPVTKITFWYANYGANDGGKFKVQVSDDGATWQDVGDAEYDPVTNAALVKATIDTIPASMTYVQFITTTGAAQRVNIDDVGIYFGVPTFSVSVDKSSGFTVNEGSSDSITATAANGTGPYSYSWSSTLGSSYRTTNGNMFTILATAPTGSYSATVTATDSTLATAQKTVTFSVVGLAPGQPGVIISGSQSGSVGVEMVLTVTVTNETANDWEITLKDPDGLDADWDYSNFPPTFSLTPAKTGTYVLTVMALTGSGNYSNRVNLTVSDGGGSTWQIGNQDGGNMFYTASNKNITIVLPTNYTLNAVYGSDVSSVGLNNLGQGLGPLSQGVDYTWTPASRTVSILCTATNRRIVRVGASH